MLSKHCLILVFSSENNPFNVGGLGAEFPVNLDQLGMGGNFMDMSNRIQQEMMQNPDMLRTLFDNPFVQRLVSNPENMRTLLTRNPQMQELMERNPEINHMLNNPDLLRQTLDLARNPSMLQELMRSHDRAISNLESIPGGYNALQRMYRDIQEPMLSATAEQFSRNPFAGLVDNTSANNPQQGRENIEPLPNPWSPQSPRATTPSATNTSTSRTEGSNLMDQIVENPAVIESIMSSSEMQSIFESLSRNPSLTENLLTTTSDPMFHDHMRNMLPQILHNPEMMNVFSNPQAISALLQIQQGMENLRQVAPNLVQSLLPGQGGANAAAAAAQTAPVPTAPVQTAPTEHTDEDPAERQAQDDRFQTVSIIDNYIVLYCIVLVFEIETNYQYNNVVL